jgi:hypothetical protein
MYQRAAVPIELELDVRSVANAVARSDEAKG